MAMLAAVVGELFSADAFVALTIAGMAIFGWRQGVFISTLVGLQVLISFVVAFALASGIVGAVHSVDVVPPERSLAVAYGVTFLASILGIRLAIGAFVTEMAVPLSRFNDAVGGAAIGMLSGYMLAGCVMVAWSLAALPGSYRFNPAMHVMQPGSWMLATFARCVEHEAGALAELLYGNASRLPRPLEPRCSEPFIDHNGNAMYDAGEPYGDVDDNGIFTAHQGFEDTQRDRRRRLGLLECYRLGAWQKVSVCHVPEIMSPERDRLTSRPLPGEPLYRTVARDADNDSALRFSLRSAASTDGLAVAPKEIPFEDLGIDPMSGVVTLTADVSGRSERFARFIVQVTDSAGLAAERQVVVSW